MKAFRLLVTALLLLSFSNAWAGEGFAIVIDPSSYSSAKAEVDAYAAAIAKADGYKIEIVEDIWSVPDSIRAVLKELRFRKKDPIVGAVFIGDIPVAMVRGAQHLASAFKMDEERYPREDSSIPTTSLPAALSLFLRTSSPAESVPWMKTGKYASTH